MDKIGHQAVIQYFNIKSLTPKKIHKDKWLLYKTMLLHTVWLKNGKLISNGVGTAWKMALNHGRPVTVTTQEIIHKIRDVLLKDRHLTE